MRVLEYAGLDTSRVREAYEKTIAAIARDDFRSADIKKLTNIVQGRFCRARLDYANRLLLTFIRHGEETCALALEVIGQHAYEKSRFLRGAAIDESKIPPVEAVEAVREAQPIRYLHPERSRIQFLDKPLSFDDVQDAVYLLAPPLIIVGSAGSGKTALTLEKLKRVDGEVLYVTQSVYLAQNARELYYAHGYEREGQDALFLSYREFIETLRAPDGREASWRDFAAWFERQRQAFMGIDAHQAYEEIRGVLTAQPGGLLTREAYRALGVRQSIFIEADRDRLYDLFERYRRWLVEAHLYDLGIVAHEWVAHVAPRYDFIVIDEVQDLTPAQLRLILCTLKTPERFLLCGDSNQIVHPNFFAWSQVKTLFWQDAQLASRQELRLLHANFRNGLETTRIANTLLRIKHRRFGSIDRESNFLVSAVGGEPGGVTLLADRDPVKKALDEQTRGSTRFAVLVLRDEDKTDARRYFRTPLVFAIHEAKGLEYDNIVLYRFVSNHRREYAEICDGVTVADLTGEELDYRRARDKTDKSLEIYKFYVNAFYVALTRALRQIYLVESDTGHPLLRLLGVALADNELRVDAHASSLEEWQKEARKLELQGKQEQADAIRQTVLKETPVPWPVFDEPRLRETLLRVFRDRAPGNKPRQQLQEYAACYDDAHLIERLAEDSGASGGRGLISQHAAQHVVLGRKHYAAYFGKNFKDILRQCDLYGVEHRTPMNQTPLMAAAAAGNAPLVEALLTRGADLEATDHLGRNALHWALRRAFADPAFASAALPALYENIAPPSIDLRAGDRLVRIDRHLTEYFLLQTLWTLFKNSFPQRYAGERYGFCTATILSAWEALPGAVLKPERKQRSHLSGVLARNEINRDYAFNRRLFMRLSTGRYQFNPALSIRRRQGAQAQWTPILAALNLPLMHELQPRVSWGALRSLWAQSGGAGLPAPITGERTWAQEQAMLAEQSRCAEQARLAQSLREQSPPPEIVIESTAVEPNYPWGTPEARAQERARLRERIAADRAQRRVENDK